MPTLSEVCRACGFNPSLPVSLVSEMSLPISWPSQNQLGANARGFSGYRYRKARQEFAASLQQALALSAVPTAKLRRRAWLRRVYGHRKRPYDVANLIGGGKAIVDVLVSRGLIRDDSPQYFEGIYSQVPGSSDSIEIQLFDIL